MSLLTLHVQPETLPHSSKSVVVLKGIIDATSIPVLEQLYRLSPEIEVELDFSGVQRVNSMGLAQLLKLFEHWQARSILIRVKYVNRMTSMLFKMTGLDRFLVDESETMHTALAANGSPARESFSQVRSSTGGSPSPIHSVPNLNTVRKEPSHVPSCQTLEWQVHMQSTHQMNGWYFLNTHLQRHLSLTARLSFADALLSSRGSTASATELVFTRPFDAIQLISRHGYRAIARPSNQSDEVTILTRAADDRTHLSEFSGGRVVAASQDSFVYLLGRYLLDAGGVASDFFQYSFPGHEIKAVQMLLKGESDLLLMSSESYENLSGMTRRMLRKIDQSEAQFAFHIWCLSPKREDLIHPLETFLLSMDSNEQGHKILAELGYNSWVAPMSEDIAMLERIFTLYARSE